MKNIIAFALVALLIVACGQQDPIASNNSPETNTSTGKLTQTHDNPLQMTVYKSPTCGCCAAWVDYLDEEGFSVTSVNSDDMDSVKAKFGLPSSKLASCHTALIGDYLIEGHVPASDIKKLLAERPEDIKGLTAPGMPALSPGMGSREPKDYDVLSFTATGDTAVYSSY